jgi:sulfur-carrier protein
MSVKVLVVDQYVQKFTNDQANLDCDGKNIAELIEALEQTCPGFKARFCNEKGQPKHFLLHIKVNGENIRLLAGIDTPLEDGDKVSLELVRV